MGSRFIILLVVAAVSVSACRGRAAQPTGEPRFASIVLTDNRDTKVEKTAFAPDTPNLYALFTLADVPADTTIKSVWIAEKTDVAPENYEIDETSLIMGGKVNSGNFSLSRPTNGWPMGQYRLEFYIGDQLAHTARFQVQTPVATPMPSPPAGPSAAIIGDIVFAPNLENERPVGAATKFRTGARRIYAFFPFRDMRPEDKVEVVWFKDGEEVYAHKTTLAEVLGGNTKPSGNMWFWLTWTDGAPPGSYRVEIRVNGLPARTGTFEVTS